MTQNGMATAAPTAEEKLSAFWGSADGRLESVPPRPGEAVSVSGPLIADARVDQVLPQGATRVLDLDIPLSVSSSSGRTVDVQGRVLDLADPLTEGIYRIDRGTPTDGERDVILSSALAAKLSVDVGQRVQVNGHPMELVALVSDPRDLGRAIAVVPPAAIEDGGPLHRLLDGEHVGTARWLLHLPEQLSPDERVTLAAQGLALVEREAALRRLADDPLVESAALGLGAGLLVESALMAAAAFTVVARAQRRNIGLLAALGASRKVRSACVLRYAVLVAVSGAVAGALLGELAARIAAPVLARRTEQDWGRFDPSVVTVSLLIVVAVAAALLAAWLPARESSRLPVLPMLRESALAGTASRSQWINAMVWLILGVAGFVLMALGGPVWAGNPLLGVGAVVASVVALAGLGSDRLAAVARQPLPSIRPLSRIVIRSLAVIPARLGALVAATGLLIAIGSAGLVVSSSTVAYRSEHYQPPVPTGAVLVQTNSALTDTEVEAIVRSSGAAAAASFIPATTALDSGSDQVLAATPLLRCLERNQEVSGLITASACIDEGRTGVIFPSVGSAETSAIEAILGSSIDDQARSVFATGGAVVISTGVLDGRALDLVRLPRRSAQDDPDALAAVATLPAVQIAARPQYTDLPVAFMLPATAAQLGLDLDGAGVDVLLLPDHGPNPAPIDLGRVRRALPVDQQAQARIVTAGGPAGLGVLRAVYTALLIGTVAVGATVVGSGVALWGAESRPELSRLAVIGARRRWRLSTGAAHGGTIAALACLAGVPPGMVAGALFLGAVDVAVTIPVLALVATLVGTLLAAAAAGAAVTPKGATLIRSRL
ncbi:MAG: FtsX-like permease family protein [Pseudonocardia sp.]|nr:FtsX-like permease family protein [Pseudonocardia sp.]